jgi:hypothetical protein
LTPADILKASFDTLGFPADAQAWLLDVWRAVQVFDDVADGDEIARADLDSTIWASLVGLQINPFHVRHGASLVPVLALQILKWQGADTAEKQGEADARSYMWRAGYYDLVLMVACLVHGPEKAAALAPVVMRMYGETLDDYLKEFGHA